MASSTGRSTIRKIFKRHLSEMSPSPANEVSSRAGNKRTIRVASSEKLPLDDDSIDHVIASPPYCTRIDYAVSTSPELAFLGYDLDSDFDALRRQLIGTSTVPADMPSFPSDLGPTCTHFLSALSRHTSKASSTYYYKNHVQYFQSIGNSISEISRVLKPCGKCILVVQDSYYKDLHNDLPSIFIEMAELRDLQLLDRSDFAVSRTMED